MYHEGAEDGSVEITNKAEMEMLSEMEGERIKERETEEGV